MLKSFVQIVLAAVVLLGKWDAQLFLFYTIFLKIPLLFLSFKHVLQELRFENSGEIKAGVL